MYLFSAARIFAGNSGGTLMKKIVLTYGLISGMIIAVLVWLNTDLCMKGYISLDRGMLVGYASMLIALSMVFFGIKSYRDNYGGGRITFWKGLQIGLLISLIGGVLYWAGAATYGVAHPDLEEKVMQKYKEYNTQKMSENGASQADIDKANEDMETMAKLFQNPLLFFVACLIEILPVGIVVTLISAALLRKKEILPVESPA
jgi:hypothetical protein